MIINLMFCFVIATIMLILLSIVLNYIKKLQSPMLTVSISILIFIVVFFFGVSFVKVLKGW